MQSLISFLQNFSSLNMMNKSTIIIQINTSRCVAFLKIKHVFETTGSKRSCFVFFFLQENIPYNADYHEYYTVNKIKINPLALTINFQSLLQTYFSALFSVLFTVKKMNQNWFSSINTKQKIKQLTNEWCSQNSWIQFAHNQLLSPVTLQFIPAKDQTLKKFKTASYKSYVLKSCKLKFIPILVFMIYSQMFIL